MPTLGMVVVETKYAYFYLLVITGLAVFERWKRAVLLSDEELLEKYTSTYDNRHFGELFKRYTHIVYGVCMKYLRDSDKSKDSVMQIFEKLMEDLKTRKVDNFSHWIKVVTKNHCLMVLRKHNPEVSLGAEEIISDYFVDNDFELHPEVELTQNVALLGKAIEELSAEQQQCIRLFYLEEKTYIEISVLTEFSLNQVKSYIQNGKRNLYIYMTRKNVN